MPRSAAGVAAPSRAACARVASSARVGPLAGRTRTHAGVAVPRARVEVSRNFSRVRMGEGRLGAANRRLGAHSRRAQYGGSPVENALRRDEVLRRAPVSKSRQSRGRPMRWNSKLAKNSSKKATSRSLSTLCKHCKHYKLASRERGIVPLIPKRSTGRACRIGYLDDPRPSRIASRVQYASRREQWDECRRSAL